jgi:hypothetical protein
MEEVAARHIGMELSQLGLRRAIQRLYNPRSKKGLFQMLKNGTACRAVSRCVAGGGGIFQSGREPLRIQEGPGIPGARAGVSRMAGRSAARSRASAS